MYEYEIGKIDALPQCVEDTLPKEFVFSDLKGSKICVGKYVVKCFFTAIGPTPGPPPP